MLKFTLPMPPALNSTYLVNTDPKAERKLYKKKTARDWEREAGYMILDQWKGKREPFEGNVSMDISFYCMYDRDIDAGLKILLDVFAKQRVYIDDKQIKRLVVTIEKSAKGSRVEVVIDSLKGGE